RTELMDSVVRCTNPKCGAVMDHSMFEFAATLIAYEQQKRNEPGHVYYARFGDRVKIGYSKDVETRLGVIPHDELMATERGTLQLEKTRHKQFAEYLVPGQR